MHQHMDVILSSSERIKISELFLYDEARVNEVKSLAAKAAEKLGPVSSGIGFLGSAGWVVGGMLAMGAIETLTQRSNRKEAAKLVHAMLAAKKAADDSGTFIPVSKVSLSGSE